MVPQLWLFLVSEGYASQKQILFIWAFFIFASFIGGLFLYPAENLPQDLKTTDAEVLSCADFFVIQEVGLSYFLINHVLIWIGEYYSKNTLAVEANSAIVTVHERDKIPSGRFTEFAPGFYYYVTLTMKEYQRLPSPYKSQCISDWPFDVSEIEQWRPDLKLCKWACRFKGNL